MKRWIMLFLILLIAIWLGLKIQADPGVVFIRYQKWSIETTFWFALLSLLTVMLIFYGVKVLISRMLHFPQFVQHYLEQRAEKQAHQEMIEGFSLRLEENKKAAKHFIKAAKQKHLPFMNYLLAAEALSFEDASEDLTTYLRQAALHARTPEQRAAIEFFEIKQALLANHEAWALAKILLLLQQKPKHPTLLRWLQQIYLKQEAWEALYALRPKLQKILSPETLNQLDIKLYPALLKQWVEQDKGLPYFFRFWKSLPKSARLEEKTVIAYVEALLHYGQMQLAEKVLMSAIKEQPHPHLIAYYNDL